MVCEPEGVIGRGWAQVPGPLGTAQVPWSQARPVSQLPQSPPQPSGPQFLPSQSGTQSRQTSQPLAATVCSQLREVSSQVSMVQAMPSSQGFGPATQWPLENCSTPLQKTPSSQVTSMARSTREPKPALPYAMRQRKA